MKTKLKNTLNEKDVENIYREEILKNTSSEAKITSPHNTDGILQAKNVKTLLEFKYDIGLKSKINQSSVLIQCLYYIKKFEQAGEKLPSTLFVGDKNECFALHTNSIIKYMKEDIDWTIAPSTASKNNPQLLKAMVDDTDILPFVYDVDENFSIKEVLGKIKNLSDNIVRKIRVTKFNISSVFNYFNENVLGATNLNTNQKANLFIQVIINPESNFLNPNRKNELVSKSYGKVRVNSNQFKSFFKHFNGEDYSPKQKEELTGIVDRLVEDTIRRSKGEFFTPSNFVAKAHEYIASVYGENWRNEFVVWDNSWGTGNLTRDYIFKELYASTLEQSDIDTANQMGYNPNAIKFQFDFLNDPDSKLPKGLQDALKEGKKILFLMNPPYAGTSSFKTEGGRKNNVSKTKVGGKMRATREWGRSTQQLYAQFFYRIYEYQKTNKNIHIGVFCPPLYLTGGSFDKFRGKFFSEFGFEKGFLFQASHFSDVSAEWGINFAVFSNSPNDKKEFEHEVISLSETSFELEYEQIKIFYNTDDSVKASYWVRQPLRKIKKEDKIESLKLSSALNVRDKNPGLLSKYNMGYFFNKSNNIDSNNQNVSLLTSFYSDAHGLEINKENFKRCNALFTARKSIKRNWENSKDEYLAPNEDHPKYKQFEADSLVYSLFNNSSQQSSLRQIDYKGKKWDIKNEFFWLNREKVMELADKKGNNEVYQDAKYSDERYMYTKIKENEKLMSNKAKEVLDMANELYIEGFKYRDIMNEEHPDYHLNTWDAGYAQLKLVWQKFLPEKFKTFRDLYNEWSDELVPVIYELGFLKK